MPTITQLPTDLHQLFVNYLSYFETINYRCVFPRLKLKSRKFKHIIHERLTQLNIPAEEFCNNLKKYNNVISGSFLLQCGFHQWYPDSDLDIFCRSDHDSGYVPPDLYEEFVATNDPVLFLNTLYLDGRKIKETAKISSEFKMVEHRNAYDILPLISRKYKYYDSLLNYVIIKGDEYHPYHRNYKNPYQFIAHNFDLDICKMAFDGEKLYVYDIDQILNKESKLHIDLDKYIREGFRFAPAFRKDMNIDEYLDCMYKEVQKDRDLGYHSTYSDADLIDKLRQRVKKYEDRGFKIEEIAEIKDFQER